MRGDQAMAKLISDYDYRFSTVLDLGCGNGEHTRHFRSHGKLVTALDRMPEFGPDVVGVYEEVEFADAFDCIWSCHVLEHVRNPGLFLDKLWTDLRPRGVLAITVPPLKHNIVSGHLTLWNAGLLIYHLVLAGFDCRRAAVKTYGYNVSVIVQRGAERIVPRTRRIPDLADYFPCSFPDGKDGRIEQVNW